MFAVKPLACTSQDHVANCFMHNKLCQVHRPREELQNPAALVVNSAGTCCQAWSPEGGRLRHAHDSMHPLAIWLTQRRELAQQQQESMFFQENVPSFDVHKCIVKPLEDTHDVLYVHTGPRTFGWPANRHRLLTAGLSRQELVWVGPDTQEGIQQQFDSMFSRRCLLTGSIFFQASQDDIASWAQELADKRFRGNSQPLPTSGRGMLTACLSPGQLQRLEAYKKVYLQRCALDGTMLADLDHRPDSPGPAAGPNFPTLLRHGCIVDLNRPERIAQNVDRWLSLGFPVADSAMTRYTWPLKDFVFSFPDRVQKSFSGNCQSLPAILAWTVYVWCNVVRRDPGSPAAGTLRCWSNEFLDEEAEDVHVPAACKKARCPSPSK